MSKTLQFIVGGIALLAVGWVVRDLVAEGEGGGGDLSAGDGDNTVLVGRMDDVEDRLMKVDRELTQAGRDRTAIHRMLTRIDERLASSASSANSGAPGPLGANEALAVADNDDDEKDRKRRELRAMMKKMFAGGFQGPDEQQAFFEMARESGLLGEVLEELEEAVVNDPQSIDNKMDLAEGYVAKLFTVPAGPEQGIWGGKAMEQWGNVLKLDPEHWEAQYSVAFSYSQYPDFMNKTADAINHFERALEIQNNRPPADGHALTYLQLANLYRKQGQADKARTMLRSGLDRHPSHGELTKALAALE